MLRTNLSTRPFYNERAVHLLLGVLAAILAIVTAMQAVRILTLSRYKTELSSAIRRDRDEIDQRTREASDIRRGMNPQELAAVAASAKEANELIEQRTFSWTELFNQLEATLPENVMLTSVRPVFKDGVTHINMDIQGRRAEDNDAFFRKLEETGVFRDVSWSTEAVTDDGLHHMTMTAVYAPARQGVRPAAAKQPKGAGR